MRCSAASNLKACSPKLHGAARRRHAPLQARSHLEGQHGEVGLPCHPAERHSTAACVLWSLLRSCGRCRHPLSAHRQHIAQPLPLKQASPEHMLPAAPYVAEQAVAMFSYSKFYEGRTPVLNKPPLSFLQAVSDKPVAGEAGPLGTAQAHSPAGMPLAMSFCCLFQVSR